MPVAGFEKIVSPFSINFTSTSAFLETTFATDEATDAPLFAVSHAQRHNYNHQDRKEDHAADAFLTRAEHPNQQQQLKQEE